MNMRIVLRDRQVEIRRFSITRLKLGCPWVSNPMSWVEIRRFSITRLKQLEYYRINDSNSMVEIRRFSITRLKLIICFYSQRNTLV